MLDHALRPARIPERPSFRHNVRSWNQFQFRRTGFQPGRAAVAHRRDDACRAGRQDRSHGVAQIAFATQTQHDFRGCNDVVSKARKRFRVRRDDFNIDDERCSGSCSFFRETKGCGTFVAIGIDCGAASHGVQRDLGVVQAEARVAVHGDHAVTSVHEYAREMMTAARNRRTEAQVDANLLKGTLADSGAAIVAEATNEADIVSQQGEARGHV
jgi:hypothetical protein